MSTDNFGVHSVDLFFSISNTPAKSRAHSLPKTDARNT